MKIRLADVGYEKFTGLFGTTEFVDGVSVNEVSNAEARFLAALVRVEELDTGNDPGDNAKFQRSFEMSAPIEDPLLRGRYEAPEIDLAALQANAAALHTRESLEGVADKFGIAGLREIADPLGVKSTSIVKLIDEILTAQQRVAAPAVALQEGASGPVTPEAAE
jgi:hypothetical protein